MRRILFLALLLPVLALAQTKQITLEDIYKKGTFRSESVAGFETAKAEALFDAKALRDEEGKLYLIVSVQSMKPRKDLMGIC